MGRDGMHDKAAVGPFDPGRLTVADLRIEHDGDKRYAVLGDDYWTVPDTVPDEEAWDWGQDHLESLRVQRGAARARVQRADWETVADERAADDTEDAFQFAPDPISGLKLDGWRRAWPGTFDRLRAAGKLVVGWNVPHDGTGGSTTCGEPIGVAGLNHATSAVHWWYQRRTCAVRSCAECGPYVDASGDRKPGAWETRTARRAADKILGHLEDWKKHLNLHKPPDVMHIALSPPKAAWDDLPAEERTFDRLTALRQEGWRHLRDRFGCRGAVLVLHSHRIPGRFNDREEPEEGLHWHGIVLGRNLTGGRLTGGRTPGAAVADLYDETGWVVKNIVGRHDDPDDEDMPSPRDVFATLIYQLSHSAWPVTAELLDLPGRLYPAWTQTSGQHKALVWYGSWTKAPETVVVTPLEDDTCPLTGVGFRPEDKYDAQFDRPPPDGTVAGVVPLAFCDVDHSERRVTIRLAEYIASLGGAPVEKKGPYWMSGAAA